ncbi:FGGY family carbohydrate kinase [Halobellus ruber]|uniref:Glycerol kinase n=1 Tax=Halobellus ruber TaxID=2761102 RepID=A0A7J9SI09_9EURY|nr:FGGY family carbohydrate kinase [Halobellus ruber]MBB6645646.1 glycerol kinase [Halobellus ruber]
MSAGPYVGALDQGTGGTRFVVFDGDGSPVSSAYTTHNTVTPDVDRVEYDPLKLWGCATDTIRRVLVRADVEADRLRALGVSSQRQTVLLWEAATGRPVANALSWQDRRTADRIAALDAEDRQLIRSRTGLEPDPYFAAPNAQWLLDNGDAATGDGKPGFGDSAGTALRERAAAGNVLVGTVDSWLLYNLTGTHATDVTNAAQTMLFDIHAREWDDDLLDLFGVPRAALPTVHPSSDPTGFGETDPDGILGAAVPVTGVMGDQQAALLGRVGADRDAAKVTYGTGNFFLQHTGTEAPDADSKLLSTVWFQRAGSGPLYGLEGPVFATGTLLEWLRSVGFLERADGFDRLGPTAPRGPVQVVPGFGGLGAPYWVPGVDTAVLGVTRNTDADAVVRAAVRAIAFATRTVVDAAEAATGVDHDRLLVDGGAIQHDEFAQWQADLLGRRLVRSEVTQTTALGAGFAAGLAADVWDSIDDLDRCRTEGRTFTPSAESDAVEAAYRRWQTAVDAVAGIHGST